MADWVRVASVGECPPGKLLGVEAEGQLIVLANVEGSLYALQDRCTHQDYPLSDGELDGTRIECIYHGARYDVRTGRAVQLPAIRPVKTYEVEVRGDDVYIRAGG
jgi:3-phenylpropionate/trans-cinnamate dioxygenase ferredoxin component